jgi:signal transduction histidine kinase
MNAIQYPQHQATAILAHEMREPLAAILLSAQLMCEGASDEFTALEMCKIVERQTRFLVNIINDVLDLSRSENGSLQLRNRLFDIAEVVENAVETTGSVIAERGHDLTISLPGKQIHVMADFSRLQQVIVNLLTNAAKYTRSGGSIHLGLEAEGELVVIKVRDNGIGIAPEMLPLIFQLFKQGGQPQTGERHGLGIGLALVKSIVELHGGTVSAHSAGVESGSVFVVRLPGIVRGAVLKNGQIDRTQDRSVSVDDKPPDASPSPSMRPTTQSADETRLHGRNLSLI